MLSNKKTLEAVTIMGEVFPDATTSLVADSDFHFLIAVILSAQATDKSVNLATPALFARYPTSKELAQATPNEVEEYIKTIGLYRNKAKYLVQCAQALEQKFAGVVPQTLKELMSLPGVGRKTADVVLAERFKIPAIAVDTHVSRVSKRLGIVRQSDDVLTIEQTLMKKLPKEIWIAAHHRMIYWGRHQCMARSPKCITCPLIDSCNFGQKQLKQ